MEEGDSWKEVIQLSWGKNISKDSSKSFLLRSVVSCLHPCPGLDHRNARSTCASCTQSISHGLSREVPHLASPSGLCCPHLWIPRRDEMASELPFCNLPGAPTMKDLNGFREQPSYHELFIIWPWECLQQERKESLAKYLHESALTSRSDRIHCHQMQVLGLEIIALCNSVDS